MNIKINPINNPDPIFSYQPLWGSWKVDSLIGEGSYGKVYKVIRSELGYTYTSAVKIITIPSKEQLREAVSSFGDEEDTLRSYFEGMVENILSEINLLYRLRGSPNIVVYEDHMVVAKKDSLGWDILLRMEHVTSLPSYLSRNRLNRENIIKLGLDICTAISLCAKNNIIHRDIKDENIFVSKDAVFKLGDFGIAKELSKSGKAASFRGTPLFMSPEVFRGEKYDVRSDIYSLGIVMYKLLNKGRVPFMPLYPEKVGYKDSENAIVKRFSGEAITLPTHSGKDLGSIVLKAISYRKEDRYEDPMEMKKALQEILTTMDSKLLNEDVSFLTSAKEVKREDKTIPIFVPLPVEKPIVKEEKHPTKKEAKVSDKKDIVHKEPVVADKSKTKTNITKKLLAIGIPSVVFILAVIALIVFMFFKTSSETSETVSDETKISENTTQELVYTYKILLNSNSDGDWDIYSMNIDGTGLTNLTDDDLEQWSPNYSISSSKIVYTCRTVIGDGTSDEIFIMDIDGSNKKQLTDNDFMDWAPCISYDGTKVAFISERITGDTEIYIMNSDGSNEKKLTFGLKAEWPKFSPDGKKIVFSSWIYGIQDIYIIDIDGNKLARLTNNKTFDGFPNFSSDGKRIVFTSERDGNAEIYIMNIDDSNQTRLTNYTYWDGFPAFSLNGNKITFTRVDSNDQSHIYTMNPDGSGEKLINTALQKEISASVFVKNEVSSGNIIEIDSKNRKGVKFIAPSLGTYEFKIVEGAWASYWYEFGMNKNFNGWRSFLSFYENKPIEWGKNQYSDEFGMGVLNESGNFGSSSLQKNCLLAEGLGKNSKLTIELEKNEYVIFVAPDYYNYFEDNYGTVIVSTRKISE